MKRNNPIRLEPKREETRTMRDSTGDAGKDGYSVLSKADPQRAGRPPLVGGVPVYQGPDYSFEQ